VETQCCITQRLNHFTALKIHNIIDQDSDANHDELVEELQQWQEELDRLQKLRPMLSNHDSLKLKEIPALQEEIKEQESHHPDISSEVEQVGSTFLAFHKYSILIRS
jgi:pterin-4a-carbinolamine dehydratase